MKLLFLSIIVFILGCNNPDKAGNNNPSALKSNDKDLVLQATQEFLAAWNKGNAQLVTDFFTDDAIRVNGVGAAGATQRGKAELEAAYVQLFTQTMPGIKMKYSDKGEVRMYSAEFAVWQGNLEIIRTDGTSTKGYIVEIFKKVGDRWLIAEAYPVFPSSPIPASTPK